MFKSMTGYGRSEVKDRVCGEFFVEIQGVNRKYCDININLPKHLLVLESKVREIILDNITRGRINVFVGQQRGYENQELNVNIELAKEYYKTLKKLKQELKLKGDIDIGLLAGLREFINISEPETVPSKVWPLIEKALRNSIKQFQSMREKEGLVILKQIEESLKNIENRVSEIEKIVPEITRLFNEKLKNRIQEIGLTVSDTDERIRKEVALLSERTDVTEELNRLKSHFIQFRLLMKKNEPVGKTIDFLIQEMMRETNTMGNKALHADVSKNIIYIKSEFEKIREQIQNVE